MRDVRGTGDMIGLDPFAGADTYRPLRPRLDRCLIYVFSAFDFEALVLKYPYASRYVAAYGTVTAEYHVLDERREPQTMFLHELAAHRRCRRVAPTRASARLRENTRVWRCRRNGRAGRRREASCVLTADALIAWVATGSGDARPARCDAPERTPPAVTQ